MFRYVTKYRSEDSPVPDLVAIAKALSDETRVRAFAALRHGELCVCQIIALLRLAPSTVSKHMSILKQAGLVASRKDGRWVHYRLPGREASKNVRDAKAWALAALEGSPQVIDDDAQMKRILKQPLGKVCAFACGAR
jgi:ArsR family transcriptional regulator